MNRDVRRFVTWLAIILFSFAIQQMVLKGGGKVTLKASAPLTGAISQSLVSSSASKAMPVYGKDYSIKSTRYFDDNTWAVVSVLPSGQQTNSAAVILERVNEVYRVVLGPGTAFSSSSTKSLPQDVLQYLKILGIPIYSPLGRAPSHES